MSANLQQIAKAVIRRAHRQGYVVPRDIRSELALAGLPEDQWKLVASLTREWLNYRQGRYYHIESVSPRLQQEQGFRACLPEARDALRVLHTLDTGSLSTVYPFVPTAPRMPAGYELCGIKVGRARGELAARSFRQYGEARPFGNRAGGEGGSWLP